MTDDLAGALGTLAAALGGAASSASGRDTRAGRRNASPASARSRCSAGSPLLKLGVAVVVGTAAFRWRVAVALLAMAVAAVGSLAVLR